MRLGLIAIGVLSLVLASCARIPTPEEANDAVLTLKEYESWAWALGIALIWGDVVLPVPQTAVIAPLGIVYGTLLGGFLGSLGLITGGLLGYGLVLTSARRYVQRFVGRKSLHKMESVFDRVEPGRSSSPAAFPTASPRRSSFSPDYNHVVKNLLYFAGAPAAVLARLFPPPTSEMPNDVFFEITGVLQVVPAALAAWSLYRILRSRQRSDSSLWSAARRSRVAT